jgi:hypothetical protein
MGAQTSEEITPGTPSRRGSKDSRASGKKCLPPKEYYRDYLLLPDREGNLVKVYPDQPGMKRAFGMPLPVLERKDGKPMTDEDYQRIAKGRHRNEYLMIQMPSNHNLGFRALRSDKRLQDSQQQQEEGRRFTSADLDQPDQATVREQCNFSPLSMADYEARLRAMRAETAAAGNDGGGDETEASFKRFISI